MMKNIFEALENKAKIDKTFRKNPPHAYIKVMKKPIDRVYNRA
jgi:hypothetical protein